MPDRAKVTVVVPWPKNPAKKPIESIMPLAGLTINGAIPKINKKLGVPPYNVSVRRPAILNGGEVPKGTNPTLREGDVLTLDP